MASVNKVELIGNLGNDPELRHTGTGQAVTNFRMATNERYRTAGGELRERTEWHRITVWGKVAEACAKYIGKGAQVRVEGKLRTRSWEDGDGAKRYTTEIYADRVDFLSPRKKDAEVSTEAQVTDDDQELLSAQVSEDDPAF